MARFLVPRRSAIVRRQSTLEALLPPGHLARFIWDKLAVTDFSEAEARYRSVQGGPGRPPYHPRVLVALWIFGMTQGLETAAMIAEACTLRDDFLWLTGGLCPSDQTLLNVLDLQPLLLSLWEQILRAMHEAGHIDLSVLAEDGSKVRANASPRSFHPAEKIDAAIVRLKARLDEKLKQAAEAPGDETRARQAQLRAVRGQLDRAERAAQQLRERAERRIRGTPRTDSRADAEAEPEPEPRFGRDDFQHDAERDVLVCPAKQELRFIGIYRADGQTGTTSTYRLYGRKSCDGCPLKAQCTEGKGRRVKLPVLRTPPVPGAPSLAAAPPAAAPPPDGQPEDVAKSVGPVASLTDPEALMMLATSQKRWEPSFNADITVTRDGIIVSQFLTTNPTDYPNFAPALRAVLSTVGQPESWVGDGHYGTHANLVLADLQRVVLYAPGAGGSPATATAAATDAQAGVGKPDEQRERRETSTKTVRFGRADFQHDADRDVLICPGEQPLRLIGTYAAGAGAYRLYGRTGCAACHLKTQCTEGTGRRVKVPTSIAEALQRPATASSPGTLAPVDSASAPDGDNTTTPLGTHLAGLVRGRDERMLARGDEFMRLRRSTVEPVHAQMRQHGLGRLHVRGRARGGAVLALASVAHNMMKWRGREEARALNAAA